MKKIRLLSFVLAISLITSACATTAQKESPGTGESVGSSSGASAEAAGAEVVQTADPEPDARIVFDSAASVEGQGAEVSGGTVTITQAGIYSVSGATTDGSIVVDAPGEEVTLLLDGVEILSSHGPAILFADAASAAVWLKSGTQNALEDSSGEEYDGALYSCVSLTIDGSGNLTVTGNREEGIASEEHLTINGGEIRVTAPDDGLNANQDGVSLITINGGTLTVVAGGDGIDSNGSMVMNGGTVISMASLADMSGGVDVDGTLTINGGTLAATGMNNSLPDAGSQQASLSLTYKSTQTAGTLVRVIQQDQELLVLEPEQDYRTLLVSSPLLSDGICEVWAGEIQQTHREAADPGVFETEGILSRFESVTYLEDTDFTSEDGGPGAGARPPRPDGEVGGTAEDAPRRQPPKGENPPAEEENPETENQSPTET